jgi:hypothetical protein
MRISSRPLGVRCVALLGCLAVSLAGGLLWISGSSGRSAGAGRAGLSVLSARAVPWPKFFADANSSTEGNSGLQIRESATGRLTDPDPVWHPQKGTYPDPVLPTPKDADAGVLALAATGPDSFVVALQQSSPLRSQAVGCATQLYSIRVNALGHVRSFTPVGHPLPGYVYYLAANAGGSTIGYAMQGRPCGKGSPGYLGVLDVSNKRTHQWSDVGMYGVSVGNVVLSGGLSMTANGRELVFPASVSPPYKTIRAYEVRMLQTDAAAGTVAARSRVLLRHPGYQLGYQAAVISPGGRSLYLCVHRGGSTIADARSQLVGYRTKGMRPYATLARFSGEDGCYGAQLDPSGRWLFVPYGVTAPRVFGPDGHQRAWGGRGRLHLARVNTVTGARSNLKLWTPDGFGSTSPPTGMDVAW